MSHPEAKDNKGKGATLDIESEGTGKRGKMVKAKEVARKIRSFDHFVYLWGEKAKYYLPPKKYITWHYISQILAREKKLLKIEQVGNPIELPKVKGFFINDLWLKYKEINSLEVYFPDMGSGQHIPRNYFFNVGLMRFYASSIQRDSNLSSLI